LNNIVEEDEGQPNYAMSRYRSVHANVFSSAKCDEPVIMDMDEDELS
jgi:hypothetical protein